MRAMLSRRLVRLAVALAFALVAGSALAFASPGDAVRARTVQVSGLIAFARWDGIYVIRPDGSGERVLRRGGAAAGVSRLAWSPDGRSLAFSNGRNEIWVMRADGSHLVRLVIAAEISAKILLGPVTWSPDGRRIAFTAIHDWSAGERARDWDIYLVKADGKNAERRKTPRSYEFDVDWSPAGDRIAFTDLFGMVFRLRVMSASGKLLRTVNPGLAYQLAMPDWSPDGRRLAFMGWPMSVDGNDSLSESEIWVMNPTGRWRRLTWNRVADSNPAWAPDGRMIAFLRGRNTSMLFRSPEKRGAGEIYVMKADGSGVTRLTYDDTEETSPAWQPVTAA